MRFASVQYLDYPRLVKFATRFAGSRKGRKEVRLRRGHSGWEGGGSSGEIEQLKEKYEKIIAELKQNASSDKEFLQMELKKRIA